jgi:uncharacterized protein (TIGR02246 family)
MSEDEHAIRSVVAQWMEATKRGDIQTVLGLMTEDALFLVPGKPPMTRAGFEEASRAQAAANLSFEGVSDILEVRAEGNLAYMVSHLAVTAKHGDRSERVKRAGHTLTVFKRVAGRWLLSRDANLLVEQ